MIGAALRWGCAAIGLRCDGAALRLGCAAMGLRCDWAALRWGCAAMGLRCDGAALRLGCAAMGLRCDWAVLRWGCAAIGAALLLGCYAIMAPLLIQITSCCCYLEMLSHISYMTSFSYFLGASNILAVLLFLFPGDNSNPAMKEAKCTVAKSSDEELLSTMQNGQT